MMHPASMRPLVSCARRSMPAQHCLCCCWGGTELARRWMGSGGMVTALHTTHSARIPAASSRSHYHCRASDAQDHPRLDRGRADHFGLAPCSSTSCSSRLQRSHSSSSSRHRHGGVRAASGGQPGHAGAAEAAHGGSGSGPPAALLSRLACAMPLELACGCAVSAGRRAGAPQRVGGAAWPHCTTYESVS